MSFAGSWARTGRLTAMPNANARQQAPKRLATVSPRRNYQPPDHTRGRFSVKPKGVACPIGPRSATISVHPGESIMRAAFSLAILLLLNSSLQAATLVVANATGETVKCHVKIGDK